MGQRGEVYSTKLIKNDRTYFFNVKENVYGDLYLNIVESKGDLESNRYIRQSVLVYQEDMGEFVREFQKSLDFIKKNSSKKNGAGEGAGDKDNDRNKNRERFDEE
jgi:hypothetical protein